MRVRSDAKLVRNEPSMREQFTRGGAVVGAMFLAAQQDEDQPRRELIRSKTGHSEKRRRTMNDAYMGGASTPEPAS
eukprot:5474614-Alexandrium_andersonii.AAC.1